MQVERGKVNGPLIVSDDYRLYGMVVGDLTVARGGSLQLFGMVTGNLRVADGGIAEVRGTVSKDVLNAGRLEVYGVIDGRLTSTSDASTTVVPGAHINGVTH